MVVCKRGKSAFVSRFGFYNKQANRLEDDSVTSVDVNSHARLRAERNKTTLQVYKPPLSHVVIWYPHIPFANIRSVGKV